MDGFGGFLSINYDGFGVTYVLTCELKVSQCEVEESGLLDSFVNFGFDL